MADKESLLSLVHDARSMGICLSWMDPIFKRQEHDIIQNLKSLFRQGNYTEQVLSCHIAQLCALEDLKNKMEGLSRAGDMAAQELEQPDSEELGNV